MRTLYTIGVSASMAHVAFSNFSPAGLPGLSQPRICRMTMLASPCYRPRHTQGCEASSSARRTSRAGVPPPALISSHHSSGETSETYHFRRRPSLLSNGIRLRSMTRFVASRISFASTTIFMSHSVSLSTPKRTKPSRHLSTSSAK